MKVKGICRGLVLTWISFLGCSLAFAQASTEPVFDGIPIKRDNGRWLALSASTSGFVLNFFDSAKKPEKADVPRATVRWRSPVKTGQQFSVLLPDGSALRLKGSKPVHPPYTFKAILCLVDKGDTVIETYIVDFSSSAAP